LKGLADLSLLLVLLVAWFQMSFLWDSIKKVVNQVASSLFVILFRD
jgi:hypothetical protein